MGTAAFHFRTHQLDPHFQRVDDLIVMTGLAVLRKRFVLTVVFLTFCHTQLIYCFADASNRC